MRLSTVLTQLNVEDVEGFVRVAERAGIAGVQFKRFRPAGNGAAHKDDYPLSLTQEADVRARIKELRDRSGLNLELIYQDGDWAKDSGCPCGTTSITLRPNGDATPCPYSEVIIGNVLNTPLSKLWATAPVLETIRSGGGCFALTVNRNPMNPALSLPVVNG